jgi:hypothetical protein
MFRRPTLHWEITNFFHKKKEFFIFLVFQWQGFRNGHIDPFYTFIESIDIWFCVWMFVVLCVDGICFSSSSRLKSLSLQPTPHPLRKNSIKTGDHFFVWYILEVKRLLYNKVIHFRPPDLVPLFRGGGSFCKKSDLDHFSFCIIYREY